MVTRIREWICRHLCGSEFFDSDASLAIDSLVKENEALRERVTELERVLHDDIPF